MPGWRQLVVREPRRGLELPLWLMRRVSIGIVSTDPQVIRRQRCVNVACLATAVNSFSHLVVNAFYDFHGLLVVNIYNIILIVAALGLPQAHRLGANLVAIILAILIICGQI